MTREPLRILLHPIALLAFAAAAQAFVNGADVRGVVTAALGILVAAATEAARTRVTPAAGATRASRLRQAAAREDGGAILGVLLALLFAVVVYLIAAYLGLPFVLCLVLGIIGAIAGWMVGAPRPEL
jgi:uncharacterized protein YacL